MVRDDEEREQLDDERKFSEVATSNEPDERARALVNLAVIV